MDVPNKTKPTKKKQPVIKQTLASLYRMAKANPLLVKGDTMETNDPKFKTVHLPDAVTRIGRKDSFLINSKSISICPVVSSGVQRSKTTSALHVKPQPTATTTSRPQESKYNKIPSRQAPSHSNAGGLNTKRAEKPVPPRRTTSTVGGVNPKAPPKEQKPGSSKETAQMVNRGPFKKPEERRPKFQNTGTHRTHRRSLSSQHFDRRRHLGVTKPEQAVIDTQITRSNETINEVSFVEVKKKGVTFKSPDMNRRRSTSFGDYNTFARAVTQSTPKPYSSNDLHGRLNNWLNSRGKSLSSFHHLKCFGLHQQIAEDDDEDKENVEQPLDLRKTDSYEALNIDLKTSEVATPEEAKQSNRLEGIELKNVVKDALEDLHKLILDGYPLEQCEAWLGMIRDKCRQIEEEPQYWECRAAIEQTRGNITSAVECYKTAIFKGAEVADVDKSLDQLLEKFSLLNIKSLDTSGEFGSRGKQMKEVRNIFKSSIIQFAVQERTLKKLQKAEGGVGKKYVATPVRRSTRLSRTNVVVTPNYKICNSLRELEPSVQTSLVFQTNTYL